LLNLAFVGLHPGETCYYWEAGRGRKFFSYFRQSCRRSMQWNVQFASHLSCSSRTEEAHFRTQNLPDA